MLERCQTDKTTHLPWYKKYKGAHSALSKEAEPVEHLAILRYGTD